MKRFSQMDGIDELPDAIVQYILNHINHARDVASCSCVSKRWKESVPYIKSLYFPRSVFDNSRVDLDAALNRMICSVECLEELTVYCPFSSASLAHWLSVKGGQLRHLELRMDTLSESVMGDGTPSKIDSVGLGTGLESLVMWGLSMTSSPNWGVFHRLNSLQITAARLKDDALADAIRMCPNLKHLALLGCDGLHFVSIELPQLEECRLDFYGKGDCSLNLSSPKLNSLEVDGCGWVQVKENHCLRNLTISNNEGKVCRVEFGKLPCLEFLTVRGVQWTWSAISSILQIATEVKHLIMKVEFTGDYDQLEPFPVIDLVGFFNCHPKLQTFGIHGAMFAALSQKDSLKNLDSKFSIPSLEEVMITVRSSLNAEQKMSTLESLLRHSSRLKKMVVRISQMKNCHISADEFFEEVCKFRSLNYKTVRVE